MVGAEKSPGQKYVAVLLVRERGRRRKMQNTWTP